MMGKKYAVIRKSFGLVILIFMSSLVIHFNRLVVMRSPETQWLGSTLGADIDSDNQIILQTSLGDRHISSNTSYSDLDPVCSSLSADKPSQTVICRLKNHLLHILSRLLASYNDVVLTGIPSHENKGDSAITVGELRALAALDKHLKHIYRDSAGSDAYKPILKDSTPKDTVILGQGGGNLGTWSMVDHQRSHVLHTLPKFKFVLLSQSAHFFNSADERYASKLYSSHADMTALMRDTSSLQTVKRSIPHMNSLLAPDMAFGIGPIDRFFPPTLDIIWINRGDKESPGRYKPQGIPDDVRYLVSDWLGWKSPVAYRDSLDDAFMITYNGLLFLQRGRVLVTDRLHGHIMAALLGMPTVILDNKIHKLTNLRDTWTRDLPNVVVAKNAQDAVTKALAFLRRSTVTRAPGYNTVLAAVPAKSNLTTHQQISSN